MDQPAVALGEREKSMRTEGEVGRIVWHDLLTDDVDTAKRFYAELLGWSYQIEHATDSVWKQGEADYPLIVAGGEAHGGIVDPEDGGPSRWLAYVRVKDVDVVTANATTLGATIVRPPFDVPGVGRNAVIQDRQGAVICSYVPTHGFPPPGGTFVWDELVTDDVERAKGFYGALFDWQAVDTDTGRTPDYTVFKRADGTDAAGPCRVISSRRAQRVG